MLKAIIVDDELPARKELAFMLEKNEGVSVIAEFEDGVETIDFLHAGQQADVVFLDIKMRRKDGVTTAWEIMQMAHHPYIVFVTGFEEYAIKAFELDAVDYILKPFDEQRLQQTVRKLKTLQTQHKLSNTHVYDYLNKQVPSGHRRLSIWSNERMVILQPSDIGYVKTDDKGKTVVCSNKGNFMTKLTLKDIQERLASSDFIRTHKSYMVNLNKIKEVVLWFNNTYMLVIDGYDDEKIPVARHYMKDFNSEFEKI
jgi:DNA-binding LytR/AlgR family response regulator